MAPLALVTQRRFEISVPVMATTISDDLDHGFRGIVKSGRLPPGITGRLGPESVVGMSRNDWSVLHWNWWSHGTGISGRNTLEYASTGVFLKIIIRSSIQQQLCEFCSQLQDVTRADKGPR